MKQVTYDPDGDVMYIYLGTAPYCKSEDRGQIIVDIGKDHSIIGVELFNVSKMLEVLTRETEERESEEEEIEDFVMLKLKG